MIVVLDRMDMVGKTCVITMINDYTKTPIPDSHSYQDAQLENCNHPLLLHS